jgi:hypothetical protein
MTTYQCSICKLEFPNPELARQYAEWCATHDSCNLKIGCKPLAEITSKSAAILAFLPNLPAQIARNGDSNAKMSDRIAHPTGDK